MKAIAVFSVILMAVVSSCVMAQDVVREYDTIARLDVDAHGQVVQVGTPDKMPAILVAPVRKTMSAWRFKSPVVNGKPVPVTTWVDATVQVVKQPNEHYGVRVVYNDNGPNLFQKVLPRYPKQAIRLHEEAYFLLSANVEIDGTVDHVQLLDHRGAHAAWFVRSMKKAIQRWRATPMRVNGKSVVTHIKFPVSFQLHEFGADPDNHNSPESAGKDSLPAWAHKPSGQFVATDSPLQRLPDAMPAKITENPASG